ncbi:Uncharacterised protein [Rhodococcus rhodochrous]|uniref:ApeA N-terminal domain 1-containing protein n=2 Tax=Rhodococcus rhodochrous TaxID=1829 RepID=UPI0007CD8C2A|nr:HEPN domain-containing protein [Rhodococcus rhodochrous]MDO1486539.1 hypothetical protein [Rhodococcus rhodochrous]SNV27894.1 Uncharacterised protein [Rhodococcus rhodochrous]
MKETELLGQWWHPRTPDLRVGGMLELDDNGFASLTAIGGVFRDEHTIGAPRELTVEPSGRAMVLHGIAGGRPVTLIDCLSMRASATGGSFTQTVRPGAVLIGIHLDSVDQKVVRGLVVEIDNLTEWSAMRTFTPTFAEGQELTGFEFSFPDPQSVKVAGTTVTLKPCRSGSWWPESLSDGRRLCEREWVSAVFEFDTNQAWEAGVDAPSALRDLVTFATRTPCAIRSRTLLVASQDGETQRVDLKVRTKPQIRESRTTDVNDYLFDLSVTSFEEIYPSWCELAAQAKSGMDVLLSLTYDRPVYYENILFNAGAAAEAFHRELFPDARTSEFSAEQHEAIIQKIRDALTKEERSWVLPKLRNQPGLKERMLDLAGCADATAVDELVTDRETWAKWLKNARNAVAHLELARLDAIPEEPRYRLADITQDLLHLVVLARLGFDADVQRRSVREFYWYQAQQFGEAVRATIREGSGTQ